MNIKYMKKDALYQIKNNLLNVHKLMKESESNKWLKNYFDDEYLGESKIQVNDFTLDTSFTNPIDGDFTNAVILYDALKEINETQAVDERLWAGLAFDQCYDYLVHRWTLKDTTRLKYRWIYFTTPRRTLFYHGLSRLWWIAHLTYLKGEEEPYKHTKYVFSHPQIMKAMTYRNFSNNEIIRKSIIKAFITYEDKGNSITTKIIDEIYKFISLLGSVSLLDAFSEEELYDKILIKLYSF